MGSSWQILKDATVYFSRGTPNLATVIPAMDHIDTVFTSACLPTSRNHPAVRAAIKIARKALNRYYSPTYASALYRIAVGMCVRIINSLSNSFLFSVLHPRHKLAYFKTVGRTREWIDTTEALVRGRFESRYAMTEAGNDREDSGDQDSEDAAEVRTLVR